MEPGRIAIGGLDEAGRARLAERAGEILRSGGLVVLPTETVYGVAASAGLGLEHLVGTFPAVVRAGHTWHAPDVQRVRRALPLRSSLHRRLVDRLMPGPVRLLVPCTPGELERACSASEAPPGVFDLGGELAVRVPEHAFARAVLGLAGVPVFMERLSAIGLPDDGQAPRALTGIELTVDDGPARLGRPSTTLRLLRSGGWEVVAEGALPARAIEERVTRTILLICTGNTCRSPMGEAIGRALSARLGEGAVPTRFVSAGIAAEDGQPASDAASAALRSMGISPERHRSRSLTRDMIERAEHIWTMTPAHAQSVVGMDPSAAGRTGTLDPSGVPIPDPIGSSEAVYRRAAERIRDLLTRRLEALDRDEPPAAGDDR